MFITTATFSKEARDYVERIDKRIVPIDGLTLVQLLIEHNVGVTVASAYQIKRVDSDYFGEEQADGMAQALKGDFALSLMTVAASLKLTPRSDANRIRLVQAIHQLASGITDRSPATTLRLDRKCAEWPIVRSHFTAEQARRKLRRLSRDTGMSNHGRPSAWLSRPLLTVAFAPTLLDIGTSTASAAACQPPDSDRGQ